MKSQQVLASLAVLVLVLGIFAGQVHAVGDSMPQDMKNMTAMCEYLNATTVRPVPYHPPTPREMHVQVDVYEGPNATYPQVKSFVTQMSNDECIQIPNVTIFNTTVLMALSDYYDEVTIGISGVGVGWRMPSTAAFDSGSTPVLINNTANDKFLVEWTIAEITKAPTNDGTYSKAASILMLTLPMLGSLLFQV